MESQMHRPLAHEQDPHHTGVVGEQDENHEKKSVLRKVKAKARKIKDTLTKHGHGHDHDQHEHVPDDRDLDEEDVEEEEEMVEDPQIHGAPMYESAAVVTGKSTGTDADPLPPSLKPETQRVTLESTDEAPRAPLNTPVGYNGTGAIRQSRDNVTGKTVMGDLPQAPQNMPVSLDPPGVDNYRRENVTLGGDAHAPPAIHLGRDTDTVNQPSRTLDYGLEQGQRQGQSGQEKVNVYGMDQDRSSGQTKVNLDRPRGLEEDTAAYKDTPDESGVASNYQTKVTDFTGKGGEEATGVGSVIKSLDKMNVDDRPEGKTRQEHDDLLSSVPTGSHDQFVPELTPPKPLSGSDIDETKPREGLLGQIQTPETESKQSSTYTSDTTGQDGTERPKNQGRYTDKLSSATSTITDKALSAKNVVASKLGYGEKKGESETSVDQSEKNSHNTNNSSSMSASAVDYGKKVASTVADKLAPVYGKVAGAGSAVVSKIPGTGTGTTTSTTTTEPRSGVEQDKGVSMKDYLAEKLRPGEEDKALKEMISEALHTGKTEKKTEQTTTTTPVKEVVSDAIHKRSGESDETPDRRMGKVTESEEVARDLGTFKENQEQGVGNKGMVDYIKDTVGSLLGKREQVQESAVGSTGSGRDDEREGQENEVSGERRPQEN